MNKKKMKKLLPLFATDDLSVDEREQISERIEKDDELSEDLIHVQEILNRITSSTSAEASSQFKRNLAGRVRMSLDGEPPARLRWKPVFSLGICIVLMVAAVYFWTYFQPDRIQETETWLVGNLGSVENGNGWSTVPVEFLSEEDLVNFNIELDKEMIKTFAVDEGMLEELPFYLDLDPDMEDDFLENKSLEYNIRKGGV